MIHVLIEHLQGRALAVERLVLESPGVGPGGTEPEAFA